MEKKQRLTGVDLSRGIAVYAVAILHSGDGVPATTGWAGILTQFSGFAVPFFLATSFYLAISKLYTSKAKYSLKSRLTRLLIPYAIWSAIYLVYRVLKYWISNKPEYLNQMFQDPISLVFLGGAAYHLYFIPLLLTGTLLIKVAEYLLEKRVKLKILVLLFVTSATLYELVLFSGNSFQLGPNVAFQGLLELVLPDGNRNPFLRLALVEVSWILRCLPYIFMAMILSYLAIDKNLLKLNAKYTILVFGIFFLLNAFGRLFLPEFLHELARGYSSLLFAISLSNNLKENHIVTNLGLCSFGIYFMHLIVIEVSKPIANKVYPDLITPVSALTLLTLATLSFLVSWVATSVLVTKQKSASKLMLGV